MNGLKARKSTIYAVAAAANVSIGTVSNYLNRPKLVSAETRARITRAIEELNFKPHVGATILSGKASRMIGLVVLDLGNPFFTDVARGAETAAREGDYLTVLCNSGGDELQELQYLLSLETHHVAGVLLSPANEHSTALLDIHKRGTPIVLMGRRSDNHCCAVTDNVYGGAVVGTHLVELGHKSICYVTGPLSATQYLLRLQGLRSTLDQAGVPPEELSIHVVPTLGSVREGREAVTSLLSQPRRPTAIFCSNDLLAIGVYIGLVEAGLRVPEDMSLIGYDDVDLASQGPVGLTTVRQPRAELGRTAAELLLRELYEGQHHIHQTIVLRPSLVVRETTGPRRAEGRRAHESVSYER